LQPPLTIRAFITLAVRVTTAHEIMLCPPVMSMQQLAALHLHNQCVSHCRFKH
jgi:hypothetical protein